MGKTVQEIAEACEVSITTVRFIVNGNADKYRIGKETQQRVAQYIAEHGLRVNHAARSLKLNKTETLGIIIPRLSNPFFARLIETFEAHCRDKGYQLIFSCAQNSDQKEADLIKMMLSRGIDGLFIACNSRQSQQYAIKKVNKPIVFIDRNFDTDSISSVITDNFMGGYQLAKVMIKQSQHELVVFVGADTLPTIASRLQGINSYCLTHAKKPPQVIKLKGNTADHGQKGMAYYLQTNHLPRCMITSSLNILEGCVYEAKKNQLQFDQHALLGTFDYHPMLAFLNNPLWVVEQNQQALVQAALEQMMGALQAPQVAHQQICIAPHLIKLNH